MMSLCTPNTYRIFTSTSTRAKWIQIKIIYIGVKTLGIMIIYHMQSLHRLFIKRVMLTRVFPKYPSVKITINGLTKNSYYRISACYLAYELN
jgi:hypothetical protein